MADTKTKIGAALALVVAVGAGAFAARSRLFSGPPPAHSSLAEPVSSNPPPRVLPPAGPAELAVVAPLTAGSEIDTWQLKELSAVDEGAIHLIFAPQKGRGRIEVLIALNDDQGPTPPMVVGRYAIFYSVKRVMQSEGDALARAVAKRVEKNKDLPPPPGLAAYHPVDKKEDPL